MNQASLTSTNQQLKIGLKARDQMTKVSAISVVPPKIQLRCMYWLRGRPPYSPRAVPLCLCKKSRPCLSHRCGQTLVLSKKRNDRVQNLRASVSSFPVPFPKQRFSYFREPFVLPWILLDVCVGASHLGECGCPERMFEIDCLDLPGFYPNRLFFLTQGLVIHNQKECDLVRKYWS